MEIRKGTVAIDRSVIGTGRLVLVKDVFDKDVLGKDTISPETTCKIRSFTGTIRLVRRGFLTVLFHASKETKTVTEAINSQPRKVVKKLLEEL